MIAFIPELDWMPMRAENVSVLFFALFSETYIDWNIALRIY